MKKPGILMGVWFLLCIAGNAQTVEVDDFPMIKQIRSRWCWAACAEMLDSFYFGAKKHCSQCEFALLYLDTLYKDKKITHTLKCPSDPNTCNEVQSNSTGNTYFSFSSPYFGPRYEELLARIGLYSSFEKKPSFNDIKNEIDNQRPLVAFVSTTLNPLDVSHVVIVKGYRITAADTFLLLNDPWFHSATPGCTYTTSAEFNFTGTTQPGSIKSIVAFHINIHPKNMLMSAPTSFRRTSNFAQLQESNPPKIEIEEDTVRIPVKVLSIKKLKSVIPKPFAKKFYQNEIYELYSPSAKRSYVYEKTNRGWTLLEIKNANYPIDLMVNKGKDTLEINGFKDAKITIWQYPLTPFYYFYEFQHEGKTKVVPLSDINRNKGANLESGIYYNPNVVMNRLRKYNRYFFDVKPFLFFGHKKGIF